MDGKQTVGFLRWRHNNDYTVQYTNGDEGRVENQQKFLKATGRSGAADQERDQDPLDRRGRVQNVKTDFSAGELLWMGMQAMQIDNSSIQFFTLPGYGKMSTAGTRCSIRSSSRITTRRWTGKQVFQPLRGADLQAGHRRRTGYHYLLGRLCKLGRGK